jgi:hypothetical protein
MLKLPRLLEADPQKRILFQNIKQFLISHPSQDSVRALFGLEFNENLQKALTYARRCGALCGGLETISALLQREEAGLVSLRSRTNSQNPQRVSRILCLSNDGSTRFFHQCEKLLIQYQDRMLGIKIDAPAILLGKTFFGKEKPVKAMLVTRKNAVIRVLSAVMAEVKLD